ncbi:uncharacterized protein LOC130719350 [Lotus japonicus]|uniref:uncharacterized protein LOC130719350 n=1 Tax=Lotus japonicus TaxID=34305 RepID=UPI002583D3D2|nr:uncharacterized protein LOC130719350 [Lotus japonicus]
MAKRLDRALGDVAWQLRFPEAYVEHLARVYSDHSPLLVRFHAPSDDRLPRPFRFQAAWAMHPSFGDLVATSWGRYAPSLTRKLHHVQRAATEFNKSVFGNIHRRKHRLEQ